MFLFTQNHFKSGFFEPLLFICIGFFLSFITFLSWNFFGLLFVIFLTILFNYLNKCDELPIFEYVLKTFLLLCLWHFPALFWMFGIEKGVFGLLGNLMVYLLIFILFYFLKKKFSLHVLSFIPFWLLFEFYWNISNFSFPWLTLGNLFSNQVYLVQWYRITGVLGGSAWILILSFLTFQVFFLKKKKSILYLSIVFAFPIFFSLFCLKSDRNLKNGSITVVTYNNEFSSSNRKSKKAFNLLKKIDTGKVYKSLVIPEGTFDFQFNEFEKTLTHHYFRKFMKENTVKNIFIGMSLNIEKNFNINSLFMLNKETLFLKVKKKLVPYIEYIPPVFHPLFKKNFYRSDFPDSVVSIIKKNGILPLLCYESVYSFFVAGRSKDVDYIYLMSSEKFMKDDFFGQKQYNNIIKLRALETGNVVLKASNFGSSFVVDINGKILCKKSEMINYFHLPKIDTPATFYSKHGKIANLAFINIFLIISLWPLKKQKERN